MFSVLSRARKSLTLAAFPLAALLLAACQPVSTGGGLPAGKPVEVALLVPAGSGDASDELLARSLENAARMAITDLGGVQIDLRVYPTAGQAAQAQAAAVQAMDEGYLPDLSIDDAVSLINTINSITSVNLDTFSPEPSIDGRGSHGGYCGPAVKPIALHMVAALARDPRITVPISGIGGLSGIADTSILLKEKGPRRISPFFIPGRLINLALALEVLVTGQVPGCLLDAALGLVLVTNSLAHRFLPSGVIALAGGYPEPARLKRRRRPPDARCT